MERHHLTEEEARLLFAPPILIPAAGDSGRFGRPKLLEKIDGIPIIRRTCAALRGGGGGYLLISVQPGDRSLAEPLSDLPGVLFVDNPEWREGMASSYRRLANLLVPHHSFVLASPGDLPWLRPETVWQIVSEAEKDPSQFLVPAVAGVPGHPVAIPLSMLSRTHELRGDEGFRHWRGEARTLAVDDTGCIRDVDVPGDVPD